MQPISEPSFVAFLHFLSVHQQAISRLDEISVQERFNLAEEFEHRRGGSFDPRRWEYFLNNPETQGVKIRSRTRISFRRKRRDLTRTLRDPLERYRKTPNKAIFLFTSEDNEIRQLLEDHWASLHDQSGDNLDIYDFTISLNRRYESFTRTYVEGLRPIPGADYNAVLDTGLPCVLIWSDKTHKVLPLAGVIGDEGKLRNFVRTLLKSLRISGTLQEWNLDEIEQLCAETAFDTASRHQRPIRPEPCDIFLSYSRKDIALVQNVQSALEAYGISTWYDGFIQCGERFRSRIKSQIEVAKATIVCLTEASVRSPWVLREAELAAGLQTVCPIQFDECDLPQSLSSFNSYRITPREFVSGNPKVLGLIESITGRAPNLKLIESRLHVPQIPSSADGTLAEPARRHQSEEPVLVEAKRKASNTISSKETKRQIRRLESYLKMTREPDGTAEEILERFRRILSKQP